MVWQLKERYKFDWNRIFGKDAWHIEYSITDKCNRNCAACSHLAPLSKRPNFVSKEEFEQVTANLNRCLPDIHTFWLTGGEPTLHPEYISLLNIARHLYSEAYIGIYTNGTTLRKFEQDEWFWQFIKDNGIVWGVTIYNGEKRYIEELFDKHDCINNLAIVRNGSSFTNLTNYSKGQEVSRKKYEKCGWERRKINVRNGKIFNCPTCEFADLFNEYFNESLKVTEQDYLIVNDLLTKEQVEEFKNPMPFCSQCNLDIRYKRLFMNQSSKRLMEEWADIETFMQK